MKKEELENIALFHDIIRSRDLMAFLFGGLVISIGMVVVNASDLIVETIINNRRTKKEVKMWSKLIDKLKKKKEESVD